LVKVSYVLGCKLQYSGCVNRSVVSFVYSLLMNYSVWCTLSEWLVKLWTPACSHWASFKCFTLLLVCRGLL